MQLMITPYWGRPPQKNSGDAAPIGLPETIHSPALCQPRLIKMLD